LINLPQQIEKGHHMVLTDLQSRWLPLIEDHLQSFLDSLDFGGSAGLKAMLVHHMGWSEGEGDSGTHGKRIRPLLTLLCAFAYDTGREESILPAALAVELLHNFTLIHDDIEDQSPLRHGRTTLWKKWGIPQAINAGDALFSIAQLALLDLSKTCKDSITVQAALRFNQVCLHLTCGQYLDIAFESQDAIDTEAYLEMIRGKTAALIGFSTQMGGLIAGADEDRCNMLYRFGENLGMAFQIQDDYLGVWGNPAVTGKSAASDLQSRKLSLPVIFGLERSPEFRSLWKQGKTFTSGEIAQLTMLLESCGAPEYVRGQAEAYTENAFLALKQAFPNQNLYTEALIELSWKLLNRKA